MRLRALLVDLDGVVRHWAGETQHEIERRHGLPHGALTEAAFAPELMRPAILGTHDDATWRAAIADRLAVEHPRADARAAVAEWARSPGAADPAAVAFLDARRADHVICFVTNATSRLRADLAALDLLAHCDHVISSADLGVAKPDERFFRAAARIAGVPPQRCLLVDDHEPNVRAAERAAMAGHLFTGLAGLENRCAAWDAELRVADEDPGVPVVTDRPAVRVLCLDPAERLLLLRFRDPVSGDELWEPPGGRIEAGETPAAAAVRELLEETGYAAPVAPAGGVAVRRDYLWCGERVHNDERFFLARVSGEPDREPRLGADEAEILAGSRWWHWAELAGSGERTDPAELAGLVAGLAPESRWARVPRIAVDGEEP
jgi:HAD superfamily hydrolase (TIGR01509 family)